MPADRPASPEPSRYHRQTLLPGVGDAGQLRLANSHALIVGVGALGCASSELLARAGVGRITLLDRDIVEITNLQRQSLFDERDAAEGIPKAIAAARRLHRINSQINVTPIVEDFTPRVARRRFAAWRADVVLDGTDNFETRYLLNDLAVRHGVPYCYGGVVGTRGMTMTVRPSATPCLRCVFNLPPPAGSTPTCDTSGVLGSAVQVVAARQATDALKILLGQGALVKPELHEFDLWTCAHRSIALSLARDTNSCVCCGMGSFEYADAPSDDGAVVLCGQHSVQIPARSRVDPASTAVDGLTREHDNPVDMDALADRLRAHGPVDQRGYFLRATLNHERSSTPSPVVLTVFPDGRAIIRGVTSPTVARTLYARYVGS